MFSKNFVSGGRGWIYIRELTFINISVGWVLDLLGVGNILNALLLPTQVRQLFTSNILK